MTWKRDTRSENVRTIGDFTIYSEVDKDEGTAHVVRFGDGSELRVLPDDQHSGQARAARVSAIMPALEALAATSSLSEADVDPMVYLRGALAGAGLSWEEPGLRELTFEEWFNDAAVAGWIDAAQFIEEAEEAGFEIRRREP